MNEKKAPDPDDRRRGDRRSAPEQPLPPEQERRQKDRRGGDGD
jgi:hypothetical protein